jgi:hypothetical protein
LCADRSLGGDEIDPLTYFDVIEARAQTPGPGAHERQAAPRIWGRAVAQTIWNLARGA